MDFDQVAVNGANSNHIKKGGVIMASTIRDVAARAGLSVGTVSKLFFHLVGHLVGHFFINYANL